MAASVTGIDGCASGWVAVTLSGAGDAVTVAVAAALDGLALDGAAITGVDMPLGLLAAGWRSATNPRVP